VALTVADRQIGAELYALAEAYDHLAEMRRTSHETDLSELAFSLARHGRHGQPH